MKRAGAGKKRGAGRSQERSLFDLLGGAPAHPRHNAAGGEDVGGGRGARRGGAGPAASDEAGPAASDEAGYNASAITVLEGLEPVRRRPGMYIGSVDSRGLHHLVWEIVDNAIDEVMNGYAATVEVTISKDRRTVTVTDDGRGIPVDRHPGKKVSALQVILTTLHAGAKFENGTYLHSGGLHGVGSSVVNALSEELVATVKRGGKRYRQSYVRGEPQGRLKVVGACRGTGTTIQFTPDSEIFPSTEFNPETIRRTLDERAYLHRGLEVIWRDEAKGGKERIHHPEGLTAYLARRVAEAEERVLTGQVFSLEREKPVRFECALAWTGARETRIDAYVNGIRTPQGGTHEAAIRGGVLSAVKSYFETHGVRPPKGVRVTNDDIREGLFAVVSVFIPDPQFQGQTKDRLHAPQIKAPLDQAFRPAVEGWLHENKTVAEAVQGRVFTAARSRIASRLAVERVRRASPITRRLNLPGKLSDCSSTRPDLCELFIVEGDSAGGTAKQGRDRRTQAVLPLRGKVLNAEQATAQKLAKNKELECVILALGCGSGKALDLSRLRYHKVILLMDADADGHHISTLLMTFFFRAMPELIAAGHLYLAEPPLYKVAYKKTTRWARSDEELERYLRKLKPGARPMIQRFKGLGEMSAASLKETTLDPATRRLLRIETRDPAAADQALRELMGRKPEYRYRLVMDRAQEVWDVDA